jgi:hypothetical protein
MSRASAPARVRALAAAALLLLVLPSALAATDEDAAAGPVSPYALFDGVSYYMLAGVVNGSSLAVDSGGGERLLAFEGCAFVQVRPDLDRGRVAIAGMVDGATPLQVTFEEFDGNLGSQGPIAANLTLDPAALPVMPAGKTARGQVAGEAVATMKAAEVWDPIDERYRAANFTDPVGGGEELRALLAVSEDGVRDDETGARQDALDEGDHELHIVLSSPPGASPSKDSFGFASNPELPEGSTMPDAEHAATYEFLNTRFGGTASMTLTLSTKAPPGFNALTLAVRAPDGAEVGNATVEASVLAPGTATLQFPADQLGVYHVLVTGKLMLGSYTIAVQLDPAPAFQMDFWWEDPVPGATAPDAFGECQKQLGLRAQVVAGRVDRASPPGFPLQVVVIAIVASVITALLVVKLVMDQVSSSAFRKLKK